MTKLRKSPAEAILEQQLESRIHKMNSGLEIVDRRARVRVWLNQINSSLSLDMAGNIELFYNNSLLEGSNARQQALRGLLNHLKSLDIIGVKRMDENQKKYIFVDPKMQKEAEHLLDIFEAIGKIMTTMNVKILDVKNYLSSNNQLASYKITIQANKGRVDYAILYKNEKSKWRSLSLAESDRQEMVSVFEKILEFDPSLDDLDFVNGEAILDLSSPKRLVPGSPDTGEVSAVPGFATQPLPAISGPSTIQSLPYRRGAAIPTVNPVPSFPIDNITPNPSVTSLGIYRAVPENGKDPRLEDDSASRVVKTPLNQLSSGRQSQETSQGIPAVVPSNKEDKNASTSMGIHPVAEEDGIEPLTIEQDPVFEDIAATIEVLATSVEKARENQPKTSSENTTLALPRARRRSNIFGRK